MFLVTLTRSGPRWKASAPPEQQSEWQPHASVMDELVDEGFIVLGGPLADGEREADTVICPWHGSRFDLCSGEVRGGPAVYPQPRYETRIRSGKVEIRTAKD